MKKYILQKHLPNLNAGAELTLSCDRERYEIQEDDTKHYFSMYKEVVENNPEWFKLKESAKIHSIESSGQYTEGLFKYILLVNERIPIEQIKVIKNVIEKILN